MVNAVLNHVVHDSLVFVVLGTAFLGPAALNELLNALIDQYLSELVTRGADVELLSGLEGVVEGLIVVVEVEVEFGKEVGDEGTVREGGIVVEGLAG